MCFSLRGDILAVIEERVFLSFYRPDYVKPVQGSIRYWYLCLVLLLNQTSLLALDIAFSSTLTNVSVHYI